MERNLALSLVIGAVVGAGVRRAVGSTISEVGRLGKAVEDAERQKAAALKETARLDKSTQQVQNYRNLGREVLAAGQTHRAAQDKVKALAREIAASGTATKAQEKALEAARREVIAAAKAEENQKQRLAALRTELNAAGIDTQRLGDANRKLAADMTAAKAKVDQTTQSVGRVGDAMARTEKRREIGAALRNQALAVGAAYVALRQPMAVAGDLEHHLARFGNTAGMTAEELEGVRHKIRAMSTEVLQSNEALLGGIDVLVGKGMEAPQAIAAIKDIGRAATATGASVEDMANLAFAAMSNLHIPADKLEKTLNILAQSGKEGGFELKNMAHEFPQLTAAAEQMGLTGTDAAASMGAALQVAMRGAADPSIAANNMANFLQKAKADETKRNFQKLGVDLEQALIDGAEAGKNPIETVMEQIAEVTGADLNKAIEGAFDVNGNMVAGAADKISANFRLGELFGDRQVQDFLAPMLANYQEYMRIKQKSAAADGVIGRDFANMAKTYNESANRLGLAWDKLMGSVGKALMPAATWGMEKITGGVDALAELAEAAPHATFAVTGLATVMTVYKTATLASHLATTLFRRDVGGLTRELLTVGRVTGAGGSIGKVLGVGGKALGGVGLALQAGSAIGTLMDDKATREDKGGAVGGLGGAAAGAAAGALIGSVVPVIGTGVGAIVGGIAGGLGGEALGKHIAGRGTTTDIAPMAAMAGGGPVSIGPTTINVHPPAGMDVRNLADQIFKLIEDRRRSALHD